MGCSSFSGGEIQRGGSADPPLGRFKEGIVKGNPIERGSDASTACGRLSELSEWQRSASSKQSEAAAGYRNRTPAFDVLLVTFVTKQK